jgi:hypothetical protein
LFSFLLFDMTGCTVFRDENLRPAVVTVFRSRRFAIGVFLVTLTDSAPVSVSEKEGFSRGWESFFVRKDKSFIFADENKKIANENTCTGYNRRFCADQ